MSRFFYSIYGPFIEQFLAHKRSLGFGYQGVEWTFYQFDKLAFKRNESSIGISKSLADEWGQRRPTEQEKTQIIRITLVRQFSVYLSGLNYTSYLATSPKLISTYTPYIFSKEQMADIFETCDSLKVAKGHPYSSVFAVPALFRLLYGTGIRISEALNLSCDDINLKENYLILRKCKNGQDRLIPFSESLSEVCRGYFEYRKSFQFLKPTNYFFVRPTGEACTKYLSYDWFRSVLYKAGIPHGGKGLGPRLHDFRHTFSVHSLATMAEAGVDLYYSLPVLSTYLGHGSLAATDKYVRLTADMYPSIIASANKLCPSLFPEMFNERTDETN